MDCLFCNIINKEVESKILYEDDDVIAILDAYPDAPGHTLVIPKKHFEDIMEIDDETMKKVLDIAKKISKKLLNNLNANGTKFIVNYLEPQFIKHFHLHVIPTYSNKPNMDKDEVYKKIKES